MSGSNGAAAPTVAAPAAPAVPPAAAPAPTETVIISRANDRPTETISLSQATDLLTRNRRKERAATPPTNGAQPPPAADPQAAPAPPQRQQAAPAADPAPRDEGTAPGEGGVTGDDPFAAFLEKFQPGQQQSDTPEPPDNARATKSYDLVINGQPHHFTEAQLTEHFHKAQYFTQRAQQLAQQQQELQAARQQINELLPTMLPELQRQIAALEADVGQDNINWEQLAIEDPAEYARRHARMMMAQRERAKLDMLQRAQGEEQTQIMRRQMQRSHEQLSQDLPGWSDPDTRGKMQQQLRSWGLDQGFSVQELDGVYDARLIMTMTKASAFDRLMRNSRSGAAPVVPVVQRGAPPPQITRAGLPVVAAQVAFNEAPNIKNGAALLTAQKVAQRAAAARGRR